MLEMLQSEGGLDAIVETGRMPLGYYGALQKQILRDLGYEADFIDLAEMGKHKLRGYYAAAKRINPAISIAKAARTLPDALKAVRYIDEMEGRVRLDRGFERQRGSMKAVFDTFLQEISSAKNRKAWMQLTRKPPAALSAVALDKPENPPSRGDRGRILHGDGRLRQSQRGTDSRLYGPGGGNPPLDDLHPPESGI